MKNQHGGKREGAGPKILPKDEHRKQVSVYIEQVFIDEWGGRKKLQDDIKHWIYSILKKINNPKH